MMIREMKNEIKQDTNSKLIRHLGYIPFHISSWRITDEKTGKSIMLPGSLYYICPICFLDKKLENKRESITYEVFDGGDYRVEGNKWGLYKNSRTGNVVVNTTFHHCQSHILMIDENDNATKSIIRVFYEESKE